LQGGISRSSKPWNRPLPETEKDNEIEIDASRSALLFRARHSKTYMIQGIYPRADNLNDNGVRLSLHLKPGEEQTVTFAVAVGETKQEVQRIYDGLIADRNSIAEKVRQYEDLSYRYSRRYLF
jgi:hypothetical protein